MKFPPNAQKDACANSTEVKEFCSSKYWYPCIEFAQVKHPKKMVSSSVHEIFLGNGNVIFSIKRISRPISCIQFFSSFSDFVN